MQIQLILAYNFMIEYFKKNRENYPRKENEA